MEKEKIALVLVKNQETLSFNNAGEKLGVFAGKVMIFGYSHELIVMQHERSGKFYEVRNSNFQLIKRLTEFIPKDFFEGEYFCDPLYSLSMSAYFYKFHIDCMPFLRLTRQKELKYQICHSKNELILQMAAKNKIPMQVFRGFDKKSLLRKIHFSLEKIIDNDVEEEKYSFLKLHKLELKKLIQRITIEFIN